MKNILVTGGAGFIGSNFVRMVLTEYPDILVVNLDKLTYAGNLENLDGFMENDNHKFVKGDICDAKLVEEILNKYDITAVVNFAAESHVDRSLIEPGLFIETNVQGTLTLLKAALEKNVDKFLQVSTDEVYGSLGKEGMFVESTPISPNSPYSASKAAADHLVHAYGHSFGLKYNITRCSNNYGEYQFPEKMVPLMINNAVGDKDLPVYGDGMQVRDWLYVNDHCTAIWKVLNEGRVGDVYNVGGNNEKTNLEVIRQILAKIGKDESLIKYVTDRPGHDRRYAIDSSKMMNELGWAPSVTFEEGIVKTIDWYLANDQWLANIVSGDYEKYYESMYGGR
jgi:dTDP-glucose 4,6-dehydratase